MKDISNELLAIMAKYECSAVIALLILLNNEKV